MPTVGGENPSRGTKILEDMVANWKRKKPRTQVRCVLCTSGRVAPNSRSKGGWRRPRAAPKFWPEIKTE